MKCIDIRKTKVYKGRSINLSISGRGISALRLVGIDAETLKKFTIPVRGRILHTQDGTRMPFPTDRKGRVSNYEMSRNIFFETLSLEFKCRDKHGIPSVGEGLYFKK
ncbi:UNVERIFIED_CONTAM: kmo [Trichonephila clavipes]